MSFSPALKIEKRKSPFKVDSTLLLIGNSIIATIRYALNDLS